MKSPKDVFAEYLGRNRLAFTPQRALILDVFLAEEGHFTTEELYASVRERDPGVGQATVYRTLRLLTESGLADTFNVDGGTAVYEHHYGHDHHDHLICTECGRKEEVVDDDIELRQEKVARAHGFTLTKHRMLLFGICPDCRRGNAA